MATSLQHMQCIDDEPREIEYNPNEEECILAIIMNLQVQEAHDSMEDVFI